MRTAILILLLSAAAFAQPATVKYCTETVKANCVQRTDASGSLKIPTTVLAGAVASNTTWAQSTIVSDGVYNAFPSLVKIADGRLLVAYRKGASHNSSDGVFARKISNTGGMTWGDEATMYAVTGKDLRDPQIATLADGRWIMSYFAANDQSYTVRSADNGASWDTPVSVAGFGARVTACSARVVQLPNGDLLLSVYGSDNGDVALTAKSKIMRSTDGGNTWSVLATAANGSADNASYDEPNLLQLASGNLLLLIRNDSTTPHQIWKTASTDSGATWSAPSLAFAGNGSPHGVVLADGTILATTRGDLIAYPAAYATTVYRVSADSGATWTTDAEQYLAFSDATLVTSEYASPLEISPNLIGVALCQDSGGGATAPANCYFVRIADLNPPTKNASSLNVKNILTVKADSYFSSIHLAGMLFTPQSLGIQTDVLNGYTAIAIRPNGTSDTANITVFDAASGSTNRFISLGSYGTIVTGKNGAVNAYQLKMTDGSPSATVLIGNSLAVTTGGSATKIVCWKSDGKTLGYATMAAGDISACN